MKLEKKTIERLNILTHSAVLMIYLCFDCFLFYGMSLVSYNEMSLRHNIDLSYNVNTLIAKGNMTGHPDEWGDRVTPTEMVLLSDNYIESMMLTKTNHFNTILISLLFMFSLVMTVISAQRLERESRKYNVKS